MRLMRAILLVLTVALPGCGSPEQYQKQGVEADTSTVDVALGMEVGEEHGPWAREFILEMGQSRLRYDEGDTVRAFFIADSLIDAATRTLDTVPFHDPRAKFVLLMLTDLHSQTITWQELKGDAADVQRRTARFQDLATRVRYLRDSVDRSQ